MELVKQFIDLFLHLDQHARLRPGHPVRIVEVETRLDVRRHAQRATGERVGLLPGARELVC